MQKNKVISLQLPIKPLSVNKAYRAVPQGNYCTSKKSAAYRQFEKDCMKLLPQRDMILGEIELTVEFSLKNRYTTTDTGNLVKPLVDILEKAGYFENDNKIVAEHYYKYDADDWLINIHIAGL